MNVNSAQGHGCIGQLVLQFARHTTSSFESDRRPLSEPSRTNERSLRGRGRNHGLTPCIGAFYDGILGQFFDFKGQTGPRNRCAVRFDSNSLLDLTRWWVSSEVDSNGDVGTAPSSVQGNACLINLCLDVGVEVPKSYANQPVFSGPGHSAKRYA